MDIVTIINTFGFPTSCVIACGWFINKLWLSQREDNKQIMEALFKAQNVNEGFVKVLESYKDDMQEIKIDIKEIKENIL